MNRTASNITLVCYDITSNKLRRKIDKCMKDFGTRLQFSMFICRLDADGVSSCRVRLQQLLEAYSSERKANDSLIIFERFRPEIADSLLGTRIASEFPAFGIL